MASRGPLETITVERIYGISAYRKIRYNSTMAARGCEFWQVKGGGYLCSKCYNKIESNGEGHSSRCVCTGQSPPVEAAGSSGSSPFSASYGGAASSANYGGAAAASSSSSSSSSIPLARAGEQQVFKIILEVGKCYEHIEATRSVYMGETRVYFSTNQPVYVGKYLRDVRVGGYGDGAENFAIFQNPEEEKTIRISDNTCFVEVPCKLDVDVLSKARDQAVRNIYEKATGESAAPGTGPANLIRAFAGIKVPKGAEGGHRRKTYRKQRRQQKRKNRRSRKN